MRWLHTGAYNPYLGELSVYPGRQELGVRVW